MHIPEDIEVRLMENLEKLNKFLEDTDKYDSKIDYDTWLEHQLSAKPLFDIERDLIQEWIDRDPSPENIEYQKRMDEQRESMLRMQSTVMRMARNRGDQKIINQSIEIITTQRDKLVSDITETSNFVDEN